MMKRGFQFTFFALLVFSIQGVQAQTGIQKIQGEWLMTLKYGQPADDYAWEGGYLMFKEKEAMETTAAGPLFQDEPNKAILRYVPGNEYPHDKHRYVSTGMIETGKNELFLLSGWRFTENSWKKEIDILLNLNADNTVPDSLQKVLANARDKWVILANKHQPLAHIQESYTPDAVYFSNGRSSVGTAAIAERYQYMANPVYQVDLESRELWNIEGDRVLELGRYFTGAEKTGTGGIYVIIWEKQASGDWKISLDFNF